MQRGKMTRIPRAHPRNSRWRHILIISIIIINHHHDHHYDHYHNDNGDHQSPLWSTQNGFSLSSLDNQLSSFAMIIFELMMTREWCFSLSCSAPRAWDQLLESDGFLFKNPIYKCTLCIAQSNRRTMSKLTRGYCVVSSSELNHNHN